MRIAVKKPLAYVLLQPEGGFSDGDSSLPGEPTNHCKFSS